MSGKTDVEDRFREVLRDERRGEPVEIGDPTTRPEVQPFLFFAVDPYDNGDRATSLGSPEFRERRPLSVQWHGMKSVTLTITNSGETASDLIRVDWELRYCTAPEHGPADGFTVDHAAEQTGDTLSAVVTVAAIPARSPYPLSLKLADPGDRGIPAGNVANIYIRARVSSLWTKRIPSSQWSFATDPQVIEATLRVAPTRFVPSRGVFWSALIKRIRLMRRDRGAPAWKR